MLNKCCKLIILSHLCKGDSETINSKKPLKNSKAKMKTITAIVVIVTMLMFKPTIRPNENMI